MATCRGMALVSTLLGVGLILVALQDVFHQLFHPAGSGTLSKHLLHGIFRAVRALSRGAPRRLALAGPLGVASVLCAWGVLLAAGWALIYAPRLPGAFLFQSGMSAPQQQGAGTALYLSLVTLATLGFGDIVPTGTPLRVLTTLEAFMGFALLSAGVTWVLSLSPALVRQRSLAHHAHLLATFPGGPQAFLQQAGASAAATLISTFTAGVVSARSDLLHFSAIQYFHSAERRTSMASAAATLHRLGQDAQREGQPEAVRAHGALLAQAVEDLLDVVAASLLRRRGLGASETLTAYHRAHHPRESFPAGRP